MAKTKKIKSIKSIKQPKIDENQIILTDDRFRIIDGIAYPRATFILQWYPKNEAFNRWLGNAESFDEAERIKVEAGREGSLIHRAIEDLIQGQTLLYSDFSETAWRKISSFVQWTKDTKPKFVKTEQVVVSKEYMYCGQYDCLAEINGELYLIDWKSGSNIFPSFWLQIASYANALMENDFKKELPNINPATIGKYQKNHKKNYFLPLSQSNTSLKQRILNYNLKRK